MMLLRLITWPYVRQHLLRCMLTTAGIVMGVAVLVGMHTANQSVLFAFNRTVEKIAGTTQLQVTAGETGFDEKALEKIQDTPGVEVAVPVIEASVQTGLAGQGNLAILGVDMTGDRSLREYELEENEEAVDDPLVFLAQPDSLIITQQFSERTGLRVNRKLTMQTMQGPKQFTVRGIMKAGGMAQAFGGNLAVMDVYAAQMVFGRGTLIDRVDIRVAPGEDVTAVRDRLRSALGTGLEVDQPSARGQQFEAMAQIYSMTADISSVFALFIGLFLIYNTFSIAVTQRRGEIGILRALGATQGQIRGLFLIESGIAGLFGSILGVGVGLLIARGMAGYLSSFLGEVYGVAQRAEEISADPRLLIASLVIGTLTSILAGWIPARNAAGVDPVKALQKGRTQVLTAGENRSRLFAAIACLVAAGACLPFGAQPGPFYAGYFLSIIAALLLTPWLATQLTGLLRPLLKWVRPVEGALAADSLIQSPRRTSGTVAALTLSLALVIGLGGISRASYESIRQWMEVALNPDLFVATSESLTQRSFRFPESMEKDLEAISGIGEVQPVRTARIVYKGTPVMLVAGPVLKIAARVKLKNVEGDAQSMFRRAAAGEGVLVSDNFALLRKVKLGDVLDIPTPQGTVKMPVLGINIDYSDQQGTIVMEREVFKKYWGDSSVNVFRVYLQPGAQEAAVRQSIVDKLGGQTRLFVFTNEDIRDYILKLTDQWFGVTYVQIVVAVLVAILGIVNTLTVSISDRKRELGVLQAVGALRNQVRHTIWMEALTIGGLGLVLGFVLGAINLFYLLEVTKRDLAGMRLEYQFPFEIALVLVPVMLGAAFISALGPSESAVRSPLVEALEYE